MSPPACAWEWDMPNALFYTITLVTTVGHGYIYPMTDGGRVLACIYQLLGIPFTLLVLKVQYTQRAYCSS